MERRMREAIKKTERRGRNGKQRYGQNLGRK